MLNLTGLDIRPGAPDKPGEYYMCCPFCVKKGKSLDTEFKLGINTYKGIYNCYRCETKGRTKDIKEIFLLSDIEENPDLEKLESSLLKLDKKSEIPSFDLDQISWLLTKDETPLAYKYMTEERNYKDAELKQYQLRVGHSYTNEGNYKIVKWQGRILFPYFYQNKCIYVVGRSYTGKEPKYLNTPVPKNLVVYGLEDKDYSNGVILCEGIISAHAAERSTGVPAVAILGKDPLPIQLALIRSKCDKIYKSFDGDVSIEKHRKVNKTLMSQGFQVWDVSLPDNEDPDSLGSDYKSFFKKAKQLSVL